jgi:hypothetical protein
MAVRLTHTESLATDFVAVGRDLLPVSLVHLQVPVTQLSRKEDDLSNDQLCDGAGVGEGRIEDSDTLLSSVLEIHLIRADTEASNDTELLGSIEDLLGNLGLGADTDTMDITDLLNELILLQSFGVSLNLLTGSDMKERERRWVGGHVVSQ